eukprot:TRINITY_DN75319_c0_g1_i1.p1 TRINITY_DN75319_c0_g1~~TRINITY_DN75319_c0_g1_i1.p1  ORF type:complete len:491 (+),score=148.72 TRINITY_DN75319_c0_g1_i1:33-1505(+)
MLDEPRAGHMKVRINNTPYRIQGEKVFVIKQFGEGVQLYDETSDEALALSSDGSVRLNPKHTYRLFKAGPFEEGPPSSSREYAETDKRGRKRDKKDYVHSDRLVEAQQVAGHNHDSRAKRELAYNMAGMAAAGMGGMGPTTMMSPSAAAAAGVAYHHNPAAATAGGPLAAAQPPGPGMQQYSNMMGSMAGYGTPAAGGTAAAGGAGAAAANPAANYGMMYKAPTAATGAPAPPTATTTAVGQPQQPHQQQDPNQQQPAQQTPYDPTAAPGQQAMYAAAGIQQMGLPAPTPPGGPTAPDPTQPTTTSTTTANNPALDQNGMPMAEDPNEAARVQQQQMAAAAAGALPAPVGVGAQPPQPPTQPEAAPAAPEDSSSGAGGAGVSPEGDGGPTAMNVDPSVGGGAAAQQLDASQQQQLTPTGGGPPPPPAPPHQQATDQPPTVVAGVVTPAEGQPGEAPTDTQPTPADQPNEPQGTATQPAEEVKAEEQATEN